MVRAEAKRGSGAGGFNPFKKDQDKQDAAKKALEEMFKGKKDFLAAYDAQDPPSGGGGGGSGGGGWFGGFGDFSDFGDKFRGFFRGAGSALGALLLFVGAIAVMSLWQPMIALFVALVRYVLRLDARGSRRARSQAPLSEEQAKEMEGLGEAEKGAVGKYGAVGSTEAGQQEGGEEDEDDDDDLE